MRDADQMFTLPRITAIPYVPLAAPVIPVVCWDATMPARDWHVFDEPSCRRKPELIENFRDRLAENAIPDNVSWLSRRQAS